MEWIAFAIVIVATIYFAIHYRGFRRGVLFAVLGLVALVAVGGVIAWFYSQQEEQLRRVAKALIKPDQIEITDATLSLGSSEMKAVVVNRSPHHLAELALKVTVMDCPNPEPPPGFVLDKPITEENPFAKWKQSKEAKCTTVGQYVAREYGINIPSGQKRAFSGYVRFENLPTLKPNEWSWYYAVEEIVAQR